MMPEMNGKSNFAITCNLLNQFMKGRASLTDLDPAAAKALWRPTTMSLMPGVDVTGENGALPPRNAARSIDLFPSRAAPTAAAADVRVPEKKQLTIFYGGKVMVFDNFPADKARDLLQMAGNSRPAVQNHQFMPAVSAAAAVNQPKEVSATTNPVLTTTITNNNNNSNNNAPVIAAAPRPPQPNSSCVPLARKASLHRFLEKRKDRVKAKAPYDSTGSSVIVKQEECETWLGLGPQLSKPSLSSGHSR